MFREEEALEICEELAKKNKLKINILGAKQEEETIVFFFSSSEKKELKNLESELRRVLQANIQLRQISPRKKAQKVGGIGKCGLKLCCSTWLKDPASENLDKASYNFSCTTNKVGVCGNPPCCHLFEEESWGKEGFQEDKKQISSGKSDQKKQEEKKGESKAEKAKQQEKQKPKKKRIRKLKV
ncbi:MAG: regulatory iron-sulfur-containing complex subunit RicT [Patescibacteria group bacterium]|nr:regulatory iron-sulfur-containing complex subunit RicT [Patescibacteria group bacterium]